MSSFLPEYNKMIVKPWPYLKSVIFENNAHLIRYDKLLWKIKASFLTETMTTKFLQENCLIPGLQSSASQSKEGYFLFGQEPYTIWGTMRREKNDTSLELLLMNVVEGASWTLFPYLGLLDNESFYKSNLILLTVVF